MAEKNIVESPVVNQDWLAGCLGREPAELSVVEWAPVGTGQVAASFRGRLSWRGGKGPDSIIVKCPSADPTSRETGIKYGLYAKEVAWYRELRPNTEVNCPAYFGSLLNEQTGDFLLVLQDCAPAQQGDQIAGADLAQVRSGITELAHLHGAFFDKDQLAKSELTRRDPDFSKLRIALYADFWPGFRDRYKDRIDREILKMGDFFARKFEEFEMRRLKHFSLAHGDFRLDNLLFEKRVSTARPYVLDWQTLGENCPMKDVAYFIGTSFASPVDRKRHEEELLVQYFSLLRQSGALFDEKVLRREYKVQALSGVVMAVISCMLVQRTDRGDEMFALMAERPGYQALELDSVSFL